MKVELMAHSGDDLLVVNAARASFGKESEWDWVTTNEPLYFDEDGYPVGEFVKSMKTADMKLLDYLAREKHVLPFRHPQINLRIKVPIFLARQIGKHQVGMSWSEESRRYITTEPEFFWPDGWRKKAENVKQGSSDELVEEFVAHDVTEEYEQVCGKVPPTKTQVLAQTVVDYAMMQYDRLLKGGVAPELARMILPQNMYITAVWTGSLLSFYQMYKLRSEAHAQKEARDFAEMVKAKVSKLYPESWAALERHV